METINLILGVLGIIINPKNNGEQLPCPKREQMAYMSYCISPLLPLDIK